MNLKTMMSEWSWLQKYAYYVVHLQEILEQEKLTCGDRNQISGWFWGWKIEKRCGELSGWEKCSMSLYIFFRMDWTKHLKPEHFTFCKLYTNKKMWDKKSFSFTGLQIPVSRFESTIFKITQWYSYYILMGKCYDKTIGSFEFTFFFNK